jgi:hypothetical protein
MAVGPTRLIIDIKLLSWARRVGELRIKGTSNGGNRWMAAGTEEQMRSRAALSARSKTFFVPQGLASPTDSKVDYFRPKPKAEGGLLLAS